MDIILASKSPRRRELLYMLGAENVKIVPATSEKDVSPSLEPGEAVTNIAYYKGNEVALKSEPDSLVIAADTLVYLDGNALGKPKDESDAFEMLSRLSNRVHSVYTGIALFCNGQHMTGFERTDVHFRRMSSDEILSYIKSGEPMDKAGAYGIQGLGSVFISGIEGDFFNVMGLPICKLITMLRVPGFLPKGGCELSLFGL
jgi:septum formation protein